MEDMFILLDEGYATTGERPVSEDPFVVLLVFLELLVVVFETRGVVGRPGFIVPVPVREDAAAVTLVVGGRDGLLGTTGADTLVCLLGESELLLLRGKDGVWQVPS
jgi:hypothetical protein